MTTESDLVRPNASFDNTSWKLIKLADIGAIPFLEKDVSVRFDKEKSSLNGHAGCNTFVGNYSFDEKSLKVGPLASTKMMCGPTQMQIESEFSKALITTDNIIIIGERMQLRKGTTVLAELQALYL